MSACKAPRLFLLLAAGGCGPLLELPLCDSRSADAQVESESGRSSSIEFSEPSQSFEGGLAVSIHSPLQGVQIRYTQDGALPTGCSPLYDEAPLQLTKTTQLRAREFVNGQAVGSPTSSLYVARTFDATSNLPLVVIDSYASGKPKSHDDYSSMAFLVFEPTNTGAQLSDVPRLATGAGYRLRGQTSAGFDKAPYRLELWDEYSQDADLPVLGMPAEGDWALVGPFVDRSLIRHAFGYGLGADMGLAAPRFEFVEAYINDSNPAVAPDHYEGVYMIVETIKNHKNRLDLHQLRENDTEPGDVDGGYILKFEWSVSEEPTIQCVGSEVLRLRGKSGGDDPPNTGTCWSDLEVVDPVPLNSAQRKYLTGYVQTFHDDLHTQPFEVYRSHIDVDSFVDLFLLNELTRDIDAYIRSAYYYKDAGGPLTAGPIWDFNLTLGVGSGRHRNVEGWQWRSRKAASDWFRILGAEPQFLALASARWRELRENLLSEEGLRRRIEGLTSRLGQAAERDLLRWPVDEVSGGVFQLPSDPTWDGQVAALEQWLLRRVRWLDARL